MKINKMDLIPWTQQKMCIIVFNMSLQFCILGKCLGKNNTTDNVLEKKCLYQHSMHSIMFKKRSKK